MWNVFSTVLIQRVPGMPGSDKIQRPEMTHHVFMYGTLKRAEANHYHLETTENGHAEFIGPAQTEKSFPLIVATKYNLPFLLWAEGSGHVSTVEPCYKVTSLVRSPLHYGHPCSVPNNFP